MFLGYLLLAIIGLILGASLLYGIKLLLAKIKAWLDKQKSKPRLNRRALKEKIFGDIKEQISDLKTQIKYEKSGEKKFNMQKQLDKLQADYLVKKADYKRALKGKPPIERTENKDVNGSKQARETAAENNTTPQTAKVEEVVADAPKTKGARQAGNTGPINTNGPDLSVA
ncbi:MAG: hypothetical protein AB7S44_04165 [Spirochaetales bacterium]